MAHNPSVIFPNENEVGMRTLSVVIHLFGCSILSYCFGVRTSKEDFTSWRGLSSIPFARWLIFGVFFDSWLFIFTAGCLINGVGMSLNHAACETGVFLCIVLYAISKILIYLFLIEKVYIVWGVRADGRFSSPAYRICLGAMCGYGIILGLMIWGRIAFQQEDGSCIIGLGTLASLSLLIYDLLLNVFLTGMFLWPLRKQNRLDRSLRLVATRTLIAAVAALMTSAVNVVVLTILHGQELGWVCLGSCGTDTTINALAIFWVTGGVGEQVKSVAEDRTIQYPPLSGRDLATHTISWQEHSSAKAPISPTTSGTHTSRTQASYQYLSKPRPTSTGVLKPLRPQPAMHRHSNSVAPPAPGLSFGVWPTDTDYPIPRPGTAEETSTSQRLHRKDEEDGEEVKKPGVFKRIANALSFTGSAGSEFDLETVSVQVTVTTETDVIPATTYDEATPRHSRRKSRIGGSIAEHPENGITSTM